MQKFLKMLGKLNRSYLTTLGEKALIILETVISV